MKKHEAVFIKDMENKKLTVIRGFSAPLQKVWKAWTESEILDQWWAPKPCKAQTKAMDFKEGGFWLYCMILPNGDKHWSIERYDKIEFEKVIGNSCAFCDENGNDKPGNPAVYWTKAFSNHGHETEVNVQIDFNSEADIEKLIKMGFKEGFTAGLENLDDYLSAE